MVVAGTAGLDDIRTSAGAREAVAGGSAVYGALAGARFAPTGIAATVGEDFPVEEEEALRRAGVDLAGWRKLAGARSFRWSGAYGEDGESRITLHTELNVLGEEGVRVPEVWRGARSVFLGAMDPARQGEVLRQFGEEKPFAMLDTMGMWIREKRAELELVAMQCDAVTANAEEAAEWSGEAETGRAAEALWRAGGGRWRWVVVKDGSRGAWLAGNRTLWREPAAELGAGALVDPTGAGDSFGGAFLGALTALNGLREGGETEARLAMRLAAETAARTCRGFGTEGLKEAAR
jgi:sugar/nucleoside kinase (ribokinase family)